MSATLLALDYAAAGLAVFPLAYRSKVPLARSRGLHDATTNPATLRRWFGRGESYNIAIRTGAASGGVWVLDVDDDSSLRALELEHGGLPSTRTSQSSRGIHLWWRTNAPIQCSDSRVAKGLDVKGDGGSIIAPPSVHPDSTIYRWLTDAPIGPAPEWLVDLTRKRPPTISQRAVAAIKRPFNGPSNYGNAALEDEIAQLANTAPGARNHALNKASFCLHQLVAGGELDEAEVERRLLEAAAANGLMADPNDGPTKTRRTIESGRAAGLQQPRRRP
jgi:Bifunctional DNA primase/polymerase, N-terminal